MDFSGIDGSEVFLVIEVIMLGGIFVEKISCGDIGRFDGEVLVVVNDFIGIL